MGLGLHVPRGWLLNKLGMASPLERALALVLNTIGAQEGGLKHLGPNAEQAVHVSGLVGSIKLTVVVNERHVNLDLHLFFTVGCLGYGLGPEERLERATASTF